MKENKKLHIMFIILIAIFAISLPCRTFQNDTFFTIAIGNYILNNGITPEEHFTWHEGLQFTNSRWAFDSIISIIFNMFEFWGVYIFTIIISILIVFSIFYICKKRGINILLAFIVSIIAIYFSKDYLVARAQIISYLMFIIEIYLIEKLIENQKKRYSVLLLIDSIIIANFHASVWPVYFIIYLPYFAEYLVGKFEYNKLFEKVYCDKFNIKVLLITFIISMFTGFCTPIGLAPYTDMFKVMSGVSTDFISELSPVVIVHNENMLIILLITVLLFSNNKCCIKLSDLCMILGFALMGLMAKRNCVFLYLICALSFSRTVSKFENFENSIKEITSKINSSNKLITSICLVLICISLVNFYNNSSRHFIDEEMYPVGATEYIQDNIDIGKMRIFNHFNFGSYLEFKGIPVFIDSRSGVYCAEFNDTSILEDWLGIAYYGDVNYQDIFDKYDITHVLLYKEELINTYISRDENYNKLYEDENFVLYEKID